MVAPPFVVCVDSFRVFFFYLEIATNAGQHVARGRRDVQLIDDRRGVLDASTSAVSAFGVTEIRGHLVQRYDLKKKKEL